MNFERIIIFGLGLVGGSLALALRAGGYSGEIRGYDVDCRNLQQAFAKGCIDYAAASPQDALGGGQGLVVLAVPLEHYCELFETIGNIASSGLFVTDIGSVKNVADEWARAIMPHVPFIGGHPMAGSEKAGFWAATPCLFENAYFFLTPCQDQPLFLSGLEQLVRLIGATPVVTTPQQHDRIVARISHLPHVAAALVAGTLAGDEEISMAAFAGGGLRDTTRVAAGNPELWQNIIKYNRGEILAALEKLQAGLDELKAALLVGNYDCLRDILAAGKFVRDAVPRHSRDYLPDVYNIFVPVADQPGIIADLTRLIGEHKLNICEIEILHVRENISGAIRIGFWREADAQRAVTVLNDHGYNTDNGETYAGD